MRKLTQANRPLKLHIPRLGDDAVYLLTMEGKEQISDLFSFQVEFLSEASSPVSFAKVLGQAATVELTSTSDPARYFNGIINEITECDRDKHHIHYRAELVPAFWYWQHRVRSRIFQWSTVPDILNTVLGGLKISASLAPDYPIRQYCVQYQESDFAFASRLMEEEGISYFFEHAADHHVLILSDTRTGGRSIPEPSAIRFSHHALRSNARITRWHKTQRVVCGKHTVRDQTFLLTGKTLEATQKVAETVKIGEENLPVLADGTDSLETVYFPSIAKHFDAIGLNGEGRSSDFDKIWGERTRVGKLRAQEAVARAFRLGGASTVATFAPGFTFTLEHHGSDDGEHLLTRVHHRAKGAAPDSGDDEDLLTYENEFECIPATVTYRPERRTPRPVIPGVQTATVVTHDGEFTLDKYGRVKVKFPWDRTSETDLHASCWLRVAQVWAGKKWGSMFFPRKGNEVVVAFVNGDPDCPLVVGCVYNSVNVPPYDLPDNASIGGIHSCIVGKDGDKHFNGIFFHDDKDEAFTHTHSEASDVQHAEENRFSQVPHREVSFSGGFPV